MRKPKDIRECIHYWSAMAMPQAKCGNVSYEGPVLYSYAEPIALLLRGDRVLISNRRFSNTTGSHQSSAASATHHMRRCYAPFITRYYNSETDLLGMHRDNQDYWMRSAEYAVTELKNHPRRKIRIANRLTSILQSYNAYREFFELDWPELSSDEMRALVEERASARAAEEKLREEAYREAQRIREAEEATELLLWRAHQTERRSFSKMALRLSLDGTEIETTRGAAVPIGCAHVLWMRCFLARRANKAFIPTQVITVGPYRLNRVDADGTLVIGCHTIPYDELVLMAKKLNLITENSNGIESDRIEVDGSLCGAGCETGVGEHHATT